MRILGHYAVVVLTAGSGRYQIAGRPPIPCRAGDLLIVFPELRHAYGPDSGSRWDEWYLVFEGEVINLWRTCGLISPDNPVLRPTSPANTLAIIRSLVAASARPCAGRNPVPLMCRLQMLLASAGGGLAQAGSVLPPWARRGVQALDQVPLISPLEAARRAGLSYESFRKKFKDVFGMPPAAWRDRRAMDHARKLMYEEKLSNKEIAGRLGFCDEFHFSRRFREITGQTPAAVRRTLLGGSTPTTSRRKNVA